jgi:beta-lactamase class C
MSNSPANSLTIDPGGMVDAFVMPFIAATQTPGVVVALMYEGRQYFYNFGYADLTTETPAGELTVFELGSITKAFTAIMAAYLIEDLNQPVTNHLPFSFTPNVGLSKVTLLQLLTHTSGMPNQIPGQPGEELFAGQQPSSELVTWWQTFQKNSYPPPGNCWLYSNIGFVTAGFALSNCNQNGYGTALQDVITIPLGMTQTSANPLGAVATGYLGSATKSKPARGTAADLKSTSWDMMQFLEACINAPGASQPLGSTIAMTQAPQTTSPIDDCSTHNPIKFEMAMGWQISPLTSSGNNYSLIWKDGATSLGGFRSWMGYVTNTIGIVLLANKFLTAPVKTPAQSLAKAGRSILQSLMDISTSS